MRPILSPILKKRLETRVLDRINFFLPTKQGVWAILGVYPIKNPRFRLDKLFQPTNKGVSAKFIVLSYLGLGIWYDELFFGGGIGKQKMFETRVLDRINFSSLQIKVFRPFLEFILSKTRALDRINFFSLQTKGFQQSLSYHPIWVWDSDSINFFWRGGWGEKMSENRVLDRINFFSLQIKVFGPFWEFILSKTRACFRLDKLF